MIGIVAGGGCAISGIAVYLSSRMPYVNGWIQILLICISIILGSFYQKYQEKMVEKEVKRVGQRYDLTPEVLNHITKASVKIYLMYLGILVILVMMTWLGLYLYTKDYDFRSLIVGVLSPGLLAMLLIVLHPIQKSRFWMKVRKLY